MPKIVFADPSMFVKKNFDETYCKSISDVFAEYGMVLTSANNERVNGARVCREYFTLDETGTPRSYYWENLNDEYEQNIPRLVSKEKNPDDCEKCSYDHVYDEARYFLVAAMGIRTQKTLASKQPQIQTTSVYVPFDEEIRNYGLQKQYTGEVL
jgi:hypothetical protein